MIHGGVAGGIGGGMVGGVGVGGGGMAAGAAGGMVGGAAGGVRVGGGAGVGGGVGAGVDVDVDVGCGGGACGAVSGACFEPSGSTRAVQWQYVGAGGSYESVQQYSYAGKGAGAYEQVVVNHPVGWKIRPLCIVLVLLVLIVVVVVLYPKSDTTTTAPDFCSDDTGASLTFEQKSYCCNKFQKFCIIVTEAPTMVLPETVPAMPQGDCTYWGDPHVLTFDGGRPSFYGEGELWIVKSDSVWIQGRYMGTQYTKGLAATNKIAVGGPFMQNHVIAVGSLEGGPITVDGQPVLTTFPSTYSVGALATITYNAEGMLVDQATHIWEKHVVHMQLPMGVTVTVLRWSNYIDFRISMQKQPNQDGGCGNFNGDPSDDSTAAIFQRVGARVEEGKMLFRQRGQADLTPTEEKLLAMCPPEQLEKARRDCPHQLGNFQHNTGGLLQKVCTLDICFGSNEHALRMAKALNL